MLGMPVYKLIDEMPYEELQGWLNYFKVRPYGWRDDQRTSLLLQAQGVKQKPEKIFPTLAQLAQAERKMNSKSGMDPNFLRFLQNAREGDSADFLREVSKDDSIEH